MILDPTAPPRNASSALFPTLGKDRCWQVIQEFRIERLPFAVRLVSGDNFSPAYYDERMGWCREMVGPKLLVKDGARLMRWNRTGAWDLVVSDWRFADQSLAAAFKTVFG